VHGRLNSGDDRVASRSVVLAPAHPCYAGGVKSVLAITRLLALLALVGLILGPLARPAMATNMGSPPAAMMDGHAGMVMDHAAMGEMPCCPDEAPKSDCAKDCPLMALCASTGVQFPTTGPGLIIPATHSATLIPERAVELHGLIQRPPAKPPKA
jgi:hypothetical protein